MDQPRIAKENITADVEEEGGTVTRQIAVAGQPIPAAYDHLVPDSKATSGPNEASPAANAATRTRVQGEPADPDLGYGDTEETNAKARSGAKRTAKSGE